MEVYSTFTVSFWFLNFSLDSRILIRSSCVSSHNVQPPKRTGESLIQIVIPQTAQMRLIFVSSPQFVFCKSIASTLIEFHSYFSP